jgi:hypothetical protein
LVAVLPHRQTIIYRLPEAPLKNISLENVKARGKFGLVCHNVENFKRVDTTIVGDFEAEKQ